MKRRLFLQQAGLVSAGMPLWASIPSPRQNVERSPSAVYARLQRLSASGDEEAYWKEIRAAYSIHPTIINFNNGGVSPQPVVVQDVLDRYNRECNQIPTLTMWRELDKGREPLRGELARLAGCEAEEIAINRNSTEALDTVIMGLKLKAGDEVVHTLQDYPNMINAWKLRELRDGVVIKRIQLDLPRDDDDTIVAAFEGAMNTRTRLVHITHIINWSGRILPVRRIADAARARGIEVLVDGAHTFAHLDFKIPDLNCDYFGTSLHKWLCAPFGSGMLYVKKDKIANLFPLFPGDHPESADIRKFECLGTRSIPIEQAIGEAIRFHDTIGTPRKEARLRTLKEYWVSRAAAMPKVQIMTPGGKASCAIAAFNIEGQKPADVAAGLYEHKIHVVPVQFNGMEYVRVTPNVYTSFEDLDRLVEAIGVLVG